MSEKRKRTGDERPEDHGATAKKAKRGFAVGPDHLPDGPLRRKTQKIKSDLIQRAQIKKNYAKLKRQGKIPDEPERLPQPASTEAQNAASTAPHPDRQILIDKEEASPEPFEDAAKQDRAELKQRQRKPKPMPFKREHERGQRRKAEAEERRRAREEAEAQRQKRVQERERFQKAMAKARVGGRNGQRKLGRESKVLLQKVKRMVGEGG